MNESRTAFQSLVDRARLEPGPPVDISERVAERIRWSRPPGRFDWPIWSTAGLSVAAALMMMLVVQQQGISWNDPFGDWLGSLSSIILVMS
jgi:hypothetical protein